MNDHEAERIASAMHVLRPDWPSASVLTLIRKKLIDRPRRDVTVALSWIACEANSHTPARVLESGPWWRAAGVEGAMAARPEKVDRTGRCSICSHSVDVCQERWAGDHEFRSAAQAAKEAAASNPAALTTAIHALKASIEPTEEPPVKTLDELKAERPEFAARLEKYAERLPEMPMQETEPEEAS